MLGLAHLLILWSDDVRLHPQNTSKVQYLTLAVALSMWAALQVFTPVTLAQNAFITVLSIGYAWRQQSPWPLGLLFCTIDVGAGTYASIDTMLQISHAWFLATLLSTERAVETVVWQGVAVHVGPSCINLLMFQAAAAVGWLASTTRKLNELIENIGIMLCVALGLNFFRILSLTLLAPLAPNEDAWFVIHDSLSLGCSFILVLFIWRRLKSSSTHASPIIPAQTQSQ